MAQIPVPFSSSFRSLTLNVTTGTAPNQVTYTQPITSVLQGNNSIPITDAGILTAFNSQPIGTTFTPSIVAKYGNDSNGNALTTTSTPSVANFIPRPPTLLISRASNNVTIQYTGAPGDVPTSSARFIEADPRNTGSNEWFAVVPQGMKQAINDYAKGTSNTPFVRIPGDNSTLVLFKNIVTSLITDMSSMFNGAATFNYDISEWDTSKVTEMSAMFYNASTFNQPLNSWDTSKVTSMYLMFYNFNFSANYAFNQNIGSWVTSNVTNMSLMFRGANQFNNGNSSSIDSWDVSYVTNMSGIFARAIRFNKSLNSWNTSAVTDMSSMFFNATAFNGNVSSWNTAKVTNMNQLFYNASVFNHDISSWNTSSVTNMNSMFFNATAFNQNLSGWNVALTPTRPSLTRDGFADGSPLALPENSNKLPLFV